MNSDKVKEALLSLKIPASDFIVIFSGKASQKVNGLYRPVDASMVIHNKNFTNDNSLMLTALHEFTHHISITRGLVNGKSSHPVIFWALFHSVIKIAIDAGIYKDPYVTDKKLVEKGKAIIELFKQQNEINKKLGIALAEIEAISKERGARMEDFIDRHARIPRKQAANLAKAQIDFDLEDLMISGSPAIIDEIISQTDIDKAADLASEGASLQQINAACRLKKIIDPFIDPGDEETPEEHLENLKKKLDKELAKKKRLSEKIENLEFEVENLTKQLSLFPDDFEYQKAVGD